MPSSSKSRDSSSAPLGSVPLDPNSQCRSKEIVDKHLKEDTGYEPWAVYVMQPLGVASLLFKDEIIPEDVAQEAKGVSVGEDIVPKEASTQGLHLKKKYNCMSGILKRKLFNTLVLSWCIGLTKLFAPKT